jgi:16S rRNA (uracil1498-N3)-methyltransferase
VAIHRIYIDTDLAIGPVTIIGEEAHHAVRVKRLAAGDFVEILDGRGRIARAAITGTDKTRDGWLLAAEVGEVQLLPATSPRGHVSCPPPKGPRLSEMIDGLSQAGAALWTPLTTAFSIGEPRDSKLDRTRRIAAESSKQCGRPWLLEVGADLSFKQAITRTSDRGPLILADASGEPYQATGASVIRVILGPEGGWRADELEAARAAGAKVTRFGPHTMRIETAAVVAAAIVLDHETRQTGAGPSRPQ